MSLQPTSHTFDANGVTLAVHDWGGDGAPVLLAHPTGFHGRIWAPIAERLVAHGRHVYSFDFRGHGDSDAPPLDGDYSWHGFADDALAVDAHLGLAGDPHLLAGGHSKGGAALLLGEARAPGTYPRIWAYEPIMFPSEAPLPPDEDFGLATSRPPAPQRVAVDRGGVRRRTRRSRRSNVMTRGRRCTRTSTTACATAATACSS